MPYLVSVNAWGCVSYREGARFGLGLRVMGIPCGSSIAFRFCLVHAAVGFAVGSMSGISGDTLLDDA